MQSIITDTFIQDVWDMMNLDTARDKFTNLIKTTTINNSDKSRMLTEAALIKSKVKFDTYVLNAKFKFEGLGVIKV